MTPQYTPEVLLASMRQQHKELQTMVDLLDTTNPKTERALNTLHKAINEPGMEAKDIAFAIGQGLLVLMEANHISNVTNRANAKAKAEELEVEMKKLESMIAQRNLGIIVPGRGGRA